MNTLLKAAKAVTVEEALQPVAGWRQPTSAQKEAGNYEKYTFPWRGLRIAIENPKGSVRSGVSRTGKKWSTIYKNPYGYIKGTTGVDGDHLDVFVGDRPSSYMVYVIDQVDPGTGEFDEHKCVIGVTTKAEAKALYESNYEEGWQGFGGITSMTVPTFKEWALGEITGALKAARYFGYVAGSLT